MYDTVIHPVPGHSLMIQHIFSLIVIRLFSLTLLCSGQIESFLAKELPQECEIYGRQCHQIHSTWTLDSRVWIDKVYETLLVLDRPICNRE